MTDTKAKLEAVKASCPKGHLIIDTTPDFWGSYYDCELCGSHGEVTIFIQCESCNKGYEITVGER